MEEATASASAACAAQTKRIEEASESEGYYSEDAHHESDDGDVEVAEVLEPNVIKQVTMSVDMAKQRIVSSPAYDVGFHVDWMKDAINEIIEEWKAGKVPLQ
jgi:hypothetical protein